MGWLLGKWLPNWRRNLNFEKPIYGKDTADDTELPTIDYICSDIAFEEENGEYYYNWGVTDHYEGDYPLFLELEKDFIVKY